MFSRRLFPGLILIGTLLLAKAADTRPSILYCLADDWSWPHAGVYGDPVVRTPTFDRLAREGVLFNYCFSAAPSCTPSRAAMLTGQYPSSPRGRQLPLGIPAWEIPSLSGFTGKIWLHRRMHAQRLGTR